MAPGFGRRRFLHGAGCAACAAAGVSWLGRASSASAVASFGTLDGAARERLAEMAMDLAAKAGASYADLRISRSRWQGVRVRDGRVENPYDSTGVGFGLRLLVDGYWGFASADIVDEAHIRAVAAEAAANAGALRGLGIEPVVLERLEAHRDSWTMPMQRDPFEVPTAEKVRLLSTIDKAAKEAGASFATASADAVKEERFFASSVGSRIEQARVRLGPGFSVTIVEGGRFSSCDSLVTGRAAGWEYVEGLPLAEEAETAARQAREKLSAKPVVPGIYDLVVDSTAMFLPVHETIGHSTELDRVLGWEAGYAGTSFIKPDQRGSLRIGSPLMNIVADRTLDGAFGTIAYDDDGVKCSGREFTIIERGILKNFQMAIGQAHLIGESRSNACAYAGSPSSFPIQRMPNISMVPNPEPSSLADLIAGVEDGIYVVGRGSFSIDQQRQNFQFGGQLFYEIKNGKLGPMLRDVVWQGRTPSFWGSLDGLGDRSTYSLESHFNCGKGEPGQSAPVSSGTVAARFRKVTVLNTNSAGL